MTFPDDADVTPLGVSDEDLWYGYAHEDSWLYVHFLYRENLIERPASWPALVRLPYGVTLEDYI